MSTAALPAVTARRAPAIALDRVARTYPGGVRALDEVSLTVEHGTFLAVMGPSGSGKSTLMHCAAGLDSPTSGSVRIDGQEISGLNETRRTELRRERVGFVFQAYNLIPSLSVEDNITLPLRLAGRRPDRESLRTLTERVGLADRLSHRPAELSGGQQQRAAVVRALAAEARRRLRGRADRRAGPAQRPPGARPAARARRRPRPDGGHGHP
ncbi:ABC transporter ATP-binding protein OS=Streptomyces tendae OX=1932 GN=GUR47_20385 PE=3 SV=1 [Streptomyces tendae]